LRHSSFFRVFLPVLLFSLLGFLVMGYHPGLEDDGIYLTAVNSDLNPALYPHDSYFFRFQLQATLFDKLVAGFVRWTGSSVATAELLFQFASILLIVYSCWAIARRLFPEPRAHWAGVALVSGLFTLPVAGTALYLVDQHFHPRALATGFILLAVSRVLAGRKAQALLFLLLSVALHPIMGALGFSFCVILAIVLLEPLPSWLNFGRGIGQKAGLGAGAVFIPLGWVFQPPTPAWRKAIEMHPSLNLYHWAWYEWLGALAPIVLFCLLWRIAQKRGERLLSSFALAVFLFGLFQMAVAMVMLGPVALVRLTSLQPMRFLHLIYFFLPLIGGCLLGRHLLKNSVWRWAVFLALINGGMFLSQWQLYRGTEHLELPGRASANPWLQAFTWIRENTPTGAYFAVDPEYMAAPGEDYHSFRALAERSQLADNIKDPAVVTNIPKLGEVWEQQVQAEQGWNHFQLADFERLKAEFGVSWVLVSYPQPSGLACPWHNAILAACRIP
jgi:hypothetical protein